MKKDSLQWMNTRIQLFQESMLWDVTGEKEYLARQGPTLSVHYSMEKSMPK